MKLKIRFYFVLMRRVSGLEQLMFDQFHFACKDKQLMKLKHLIFKYYPVTWLKTFHFLVDATLVIVFICF